MLSNGDGSYVELYDLVADPMEKSDLKEENPEQVQELLRKLEEWKATLPPEPTGDVFSEERKS